MTIVKEVRATCAQVAAGAQHVRIDLDAAANVLPAEPPALDPERHYLEGSPAEVADYLLALDAINFGSGWFPTLRKRMSNDPPAPPVSGYFTVAWNLADHVRTHGPPTSAWLSQVTSAEIAGILEQDPSSELMSLYAQALRELGRFLAGPPARRALDLVTQASGSAVRLAELVGDGMSMWADRGFYKRAQILASDLALAGVAEFGDLDRLTIFADNLVPHVLRCDGVLLYDDALAARIDAGERLPLGGAEREIRACAVHACALISKRTGVSEREIDNWLWTRGQAGGQGFQYKARPRHRCRTVFY
ncbi:MAG TPA: queuosine salvage family protein [Solirubrobacteraceae bacterium]|nr:queuosine salvage family protein [Solirubrobacteraceae bacterium]